MSFLSRLRNWWVGQYRTQGRLGKMLWVAVPLLFGCCALTMISVLVNPPDDTTPPTEVAERVATFDAAEAEPTDEPAATATDEPIATDEPTATAQPTNTRPRPTSAPTDEPTAPPVRAATAIAATVAAAQPTTEPPTETSIQAPTAAPTLAPPTATAIPPTIPPTAPPATTAPTVLPQPTATLPAPVAAPGDVVISSVRYDGDVPQVESDEYAVITNQGAAVVNLSGWRLNAGEPDQNFYFPAFDLQPGQSCRVYTNEVHPDTCGFTFGRGDAIWRNSGDCGTLHDATGAEVSRFCW